MPLTINKLVDENYPSWAMYMQVYLIKQDSWNIVSGNTTQPTGSLNSQAVQSWQKKHDLADADILLNVSAKYITHCNITDAPGTWNKLKLLLHSEGHSTVTSLQHQFNSMCYEGNSMHDWVT